VTGFQGKNRFDPTSPDGPPHKLLDLSRLDPLGWRARTDLAAGLDDNSIRLSR